MEKPSADEVTMMGGDVINPITITEDLITGSDDVDEDAVALLDSTTALINLDSG